MPSLSYSKWDSIDSGSEDEGPGLTPAADFAKQLLSQWIREATNIDAGDSMRLIDFVSLSMPRINHGDNMSRAAEVIEFLDRHSPSSSALLDVLWWCRTKDEDTTDPGERTKVMKLPLARPRHPWRLRVHTEPLRVQQVMKLRGALFCALNTLEGAASFGGARQLFDALQDSEVRHYCVSAPPLTSLMDSCHCRLGPCVAAPAQVRQQRVRECALRPALPGRPAGDHAGAEGRARVGRHVAAHPHPAHPGCERARRARVCGAPCRCRSRGGRHIIDS